jgi:hypothetical protein
MSDAHGRMIKEIIMRDQLALGRSKILIKKIAVCFVHTIC